jgi:glycerophosphoryl diester phosphodiesterase
MTAARLARIVAHRGASHLAPENTMAAFRRAWQLGCEAIELDVHLSADGHLVVLHDHSLERTAGSPRLAAECTLAELRALDVGRWKGEAFVGERVPTLAEVIAAAPADTTVFIELKTPPVALAAVVAAMRALWQAAPAAALALQSFDVGLLAAMAAALPALPSYWTVGGLRRPDGTIAAYPSAVVERARSQGLAGLALDARGVPPALLVEASDAGLLVDVWTINDAEALRAWRAQPMVRWIETDRPELVAVAADPAR